MAAPGSTLACSEADNATRWEHDRQAVCRRKQSSITTPRALSPSVGPDKTLRRKKNSDAEFQQKPVPSTVPGTRNNARTNRPAAGISAAARHRRSSPPSGRRCRASSSRTSCCGPVSSRARADGRGSTHSLSASPCFSANAFAFSAFSFCLTWRCGEHVSPRPRREERAGGETHRRGGLDSGDALWLRHGLTGMCCGGENVSRRTFDADSERELRGGGCAELLGAGEEREDKAAQAAIYWRRRLLCFVDGCAGRQGEGAAFARGRGGGVVSTPSEAD